jgi:hypothetical protein
MRHYKKLLVVPLLCGAAIATGVAFAAWTSTGTGTGQARSTTSVDSVIAPGTNVADLYPGSTSSVTVTVSNPNGYPIVVNSISAGSSNLVNATCAIGSVTSDARTIDATGLFQADLATKTIAAGGSGTYTLVTHMTAGALDSCKSQTFTLPLTATLTSNA